MMRLEDYRKALKDKVCSICIDFKDDGTCGLPDRVCALDLHLPRIVEAVHRVESDRIEDYTRSIREVVCVQCPGQDDKGYCHFRDSIECALDTFAYRVVEAVDEVDQRERASALSSS